MNENPTKLEQELTYYKIQFGRLRARILFIKTLYQLIIKIKWYHLFTDPVNYERKIIFQNYMKEQ